MVLVYWRSTSWGGEASRSYLELEVLSFAIELTLDMLGEGHAGIDVDTALRVELYDDAVAWVYGGLYDIVVGVVLSDVG